MDIKFSFLFTAIVFLSSSLLISAKTYYVPIEGHCWRVRLLPRAFLVGYGNDPNCQYFPPDGDIPPPGWRPGREKISKMQQQVGNMYLYERVTDQNGDARKAWSGNITVVDDAQYADVTVISQNIQYATKEFTVVLGVPPTSSEPSAMPTLSTLPSSTPTFEPSMTPSTSVMPSSTPTFGPTAPTFEGPSVCPKGSTSGIFGDPHLSTFDRLRFDCQGSGEFITVKSAETPQFMVQERFTDVNSSLCSQASVSTGVAITDESVPTVQISTPRTTPNAALNTIGSCPIDFYVDGIPSLIGDDHGPSLDIHQAGARIRVKHVASCVHIDVRVQQTSTFGCHFLVQVFIPFNYRPGELIYGLLGTPNGNSGDDWRARDGTVLAPPASAADSIFAPSYNYCVDNWCICNENLSLFTYGEGESFDSISGCDENYTADIESDTLKMGVEKL